MLSSSKQADLYLVKGEIPRSGGFTSAMLMACRKRRVAGLREGSRLSELGGVL